MTLSRDNHVVPQFYLRSFANGQRRVLQLSKSDRDGRLVAVKRATVSADFYVMRDMDGRLHDGWERVFGTIEGLGAIAVKSACDGNWPLDDRNRERLAMWVAAQYLRTPGFRAFLEAGLEEWRTAVERDGQEILVVNRPDLTRGESEKLWARASNLYPRDSAQSVEVQFRWFQSLYGDLIASLYERQWVLTQFRQPALLTADNVVVPIDDRDERHPYAAGARIIAVALDRRHLLQLVDLRPHIDRAECGLLETAFLFNAMAVANCERHVFQHPDDDFARELWDIPDSN